MRVLEYANESVERQRLAAPPSCPTCQSPDACSSSKRPTDSSYWRCLRCGEVWNPILMVGYSTRRWHR